MTTVSTGKVGEIRRVRSGPVVLTVETRGAGEPLVVVHGLSGSRRVSLEQFTPLADRYLVVTFDQRGHGESAPVTDPAAFDPVAMGSDIGTVLDDLGLERAAVVGESMGAATALSFALRHPERVTRLFLTGPAFGTERNAQRVRLRERGQSVLDLGMEDHLTLFGRRLREEMGLSEHATARLVAGFAGHDPLSIATALMVVADWVPHEDLTELESLDIPVHIVGWRGDDLHPFALAEEMARRFPRATLAEVPSVLAVLSDPQVVMRAHLPYLTGP